MSNSVLYVAFHYPPIQMSSGVHRSVVFSRYLAAQQMDVTVLTVKPQVYSNVNLQQQTPEGVDVLKCFALDTARHLTIKGRYFGWMAQPDRWISWLPAALWQGYRYLRRTPDAAIVSTYPIATSHIIGYFLHRLSGCPWVADLRDPMLQDDYPSDPIRRKIFSWIELKIIKHASAAIVTSPGALTLYKQRYPNQATDFWHYIPNGYDEATFTNLPNWPTNNDGRFKLLHSGTIYPYERDPTALFDAITLLKLQQPQLAARLHLVLRATGHDELYQKQISERNISDIVELAPAIDYRSAAAEMLSADALLLLQAADCNYQTPAKAYEYIRAQKPVLVLAPIESDSWELMLQTGCAQRAALDDSEQIKNALISLVSQPTIVVSDYLNIEKYSRETGAKSIYNIIAKLKRKN
jgi:hypothetical protein